MAINVTTPITGAAQTGFVTPAFVVTPDNAPPGNPGEQVAVTGTTGTMTGVVAHSISLPFTLNFTRPANPRVLGSPNPVTGVIASVPMNVYKLIVRKGVQVATGQNPKVMLITVTCEVPAGSDVADPANVRAAFSAAIGALSQQSAGMGDLAINGIL